MIFLNKENIYENDLVKQSKVDWQERKYSKCPLCPADISDENVSSTSANRKRRHQKDDFDYLTGSNFSIPATLLNGGILSITGCGFPGVQKNLDKLKFKRRNNSRRLETLCNQKRVIEPDAMLGPKRTFPCSGCPINMLPFTVKRNSERDDTTSCRKRNLSKKSNDVKKSGSGSVFLGSQMAEHKSKRKQFKILETDEPEVKKTKSSFFGKRASRSSSRRSSRLKRHHSLLSIRKRHSRLSVTPAQVKTSISVETQVSFTEEKAHHHNSIPRASNRSSKNILNCTYENKSSQIEEEIPSMKEQPDFFMVPNPNKTQKSMECGRSSSENIRENCITENPVSQVLRTNSNGSPTNLTVKNEQLENNVSINDYRNENSNIVENTHDSLNLKSSQDLSASELNRFNNSFSQNVKVSQSNTLELLKKPADQQKGPPIRSECHVFPEGNIDSSTTRNNYIDVAINKAKTHDFLHEFYQEIGNEEFDREIFDDDSDEDLKQRSDDQLIIIDSSASDVHEDNPIMSDDEKRAILEEMVGPRINYFKFDSDTDNDDASPCGKYLNKLPQVFRIKTNGDLKKFEIENIVRQYRYSYLVRIMNKCPKPDLRLRRCRRSDRSERFYIDSSIKKKRLLGRSDHSKLQPSSSRRLVKRNPLCDKRMKRELGPATIWNGPSPSRRKLEAPKFCQTLDYSALFDIQFDDKQTDRSKLPEPSHIQNKDPSLFDNIQSTSHQNVKPLKNPLLVGEVWNIWEMDCVQNYLKTYQTLDDTDSLSESKGNLPKPSDTKGKSCPFAPWPCPLGPICPFPPSKTVDEDMRKEASHRQQQKTGCSKRSDGFNTLPDVPDIIKEITNFNAPAFCDMPLFKQTWLSGNGIKKVKSAIINKVSIGTVTSCECVILPKCRLLKRPTGAYNQDKLEEPCDSNFKTRRRLCDRRQSNSEHSVAQKLSKYLYKSRKDNTYHALKLSAFPAQPPCEGHTPKNYQISSDDRCIKAYSPGRKHAIGDRRNKTYKRTDDLQRTGRIRCTSSEDLKEKRQKSVYGHSAKRIKRTRTLDDFEGYTQTEDYSECQQCLEVSSDDRERIHSDRDKSLLFPRRQIDFLPTEKYSHQYNIKKTRVFPVKYQRSSSSEFKRTTRETRVRVKSFEPRSNSISKGYQAHSSNDALKHRNREFRRTNSSHLFRNEFFNELSFYADPQFPKPDFISYNTSLYHKRSHISCLPPSVASKIILNKDKCMLKNNNPVFLSESTNKYASIKGQDRSRVKRASGRHVPYNVDYF